MDYSVVIDDVRQLLADEFRGFLPGGLPATFQLRCNQRRAQLLSADGKHREWSDTVAIPAGHASAPWTVDNANFGASLAKLQESDMDCFLQAWLSSIFPDIVFKCLSATNGDEGEPMASELAQICNLCLQKLPEDDAALLAQFPEGLQLHVQAVVKTIDGLRGLSEPLPGVPLATIDFINPDDVSTCDLVLMMPKHGRGIVQRIKRSYFWQGRANEFRKFYHAELELLEPFESMEEKVDAAKGVVISEVPYATYSLQARLNEPCVEEFVDFWVARIGQLHDELRPGSCRGVMGQVSEMLETLYGFFQALSPDAMHELYVTEGLSKVARVCDAVEALQLDKFTVEAWHKSKDVRSKFRCMQTLLTREASSHRLRRIASVRGVKSWQDVGSLAGLMQDKPALAVSHEDEMLGRHIAATLVEVMELVAYADSESLEQHSKEIGECFTLMAVTPNDQQWSKLLGSVAALFTAKKKVSDLMDPGHELDAIHSQLHCLGGLKTARDELVLVKDNLPEHITDANNKALMMAFVAGPVTGVCVSSKGVWTYQAAVLAQAMTPLILSRTHEVSQIAKGGSNFKHWGDGLAENIDDMAGLCGHYDERLEPALPQISQAGALLAQEFVL